MTTTDTKFFTNEPNNTLLDRFTKILENNTQFFDVIVGYFRSSGFYKLYKSLEKIEKIRILVGLNLDWQSYRAISLGNGPVFSSVEARDMLMAKTIDEINDYSLYKKEVEDGISKFIEFIHTGKMQIKVYPRHRIHSKVYILKKYPDSEDYGKVITGSSNFTANGLVDNLEFNVELKDKGDVVYASEKFNELWEQGRDVSSDFVETITNKTYLNDTVTPYELYLKFLYEYFQERINRDLRGMESLPHGYFDLKYQKDAVQDCIDKLNKYNGVFLSDVVGLGKTIVSVMLARELLPARALIICPPNLIDEWKRHLGEFLVGGAEVISSGKLDKALAVKDNYQIIFIDEAHNFRNEMTQRFDQLHQICAGKKVVLVTATPINNRPKDIGVQMYLFQNKRNSVIPGIKNLEAFFNGLNRKQNSKLARAEYIKVVRENSEEIRNKVLQHVMVRRTRTEVLSLYEGDLKKQNVSFPTIAAPRKVYYTFNPELERAFTDSLEIIGKRMNYSRYQPALYLKTPEKAEHSEIIAQHNLSGFMKYLLVKRLESSFFAFKQSLNRFLSSYKKFIVMYDKGEIYISKDVDVFDYIETGSEAELNKLIKAGEKNIVKYTSSDFKPEYRQILENDKNYLEELINIWSKIDYDPKIEKLIETLHTDENLQKNKIIIFTESKETGSYLKTNLKKEFDDKVIFVSSTSTKKEIDKIKAGFDPTFRDEQNVKILVTTDVLSEGVNLHRSNTIINYDIPWNSTRILQRVGRVNRIGTKHKSIFIYNFFPTEQSEETIGLEKLAVAKIQAFHDTLGEDARYLTPEEEFDSYNLFERINSAASRDEDDTKSELEYLKEIREIRDNHEELFKKLKNMSVKARTAAFRQSAESEAVLTFFRRGYLKKFFIASSADTKELYFMDAAKMLKCVPNTKRLQLPAFFYSFLEKNIKEFENAISDAAINSSKDRMGGSAPRLLKIVKALQNSSKMTDYDIVYIDALSAALKDGAVGGNAVKRALKKIKIVSGEIRILNILRKEIPPEYINAKKRTAPEKQHEKKEIILSEAFVLNGK